MNKSQFTHIYEAMCILSNAQEQIDMDFNNEAWEQINHAKEHLNAAIESVDKIEFMRTLPVTCTLQEPLPPDPDAPKTVEEWQEKWDRKFYEVTSDPSAHFELQDALFIFMGSDDLPDPVDAANDAEFLYRFLDERQRELAKVHGVEN